MYFGITANHASLNNWLLFNNCINYRIFFLKISGPRPLRINLIWLWNKNQCTSLFCDQVDGDKKSPSRVFEYHPSKQRMTESILYLPLWYFWITRVVGYVTLNALEDLKLRDLKEDDRCEWSLDSPEAENERGMKAKDTEGNGAASYSKGLRHTIISTGKRRAHRACS